MFGNLRRRCHGDLLDFQHHTYLPIMILNRIAYFFWIEPIIFIRIIAIVQVCFCMVVAHALMDEMISDFGSF
jgi:hypothetical protein